MSTATLWDEVVTPREREWRALVARLRATERRLGVVHDICGEDCEAQAELRRAGPRLWFQRVHVGGLDGEHALFITYSMADARAVIEHYGVERPHLVEVVQPERTGAYTLGQFRWRGGRWVRLKLRTSGTRKSGRVKP